MGYDGRRAALNELAVRAVDVADAAREHADDARESPDKLPDKLPDELPDELPNPLEVLAGTAFDDREAELEPKPNLPPAARRADGTPRFADSSPQSAAATPPFPLSLAELSLATDAPLSIPNAAADAKYTAALRAVRGGKRAVRRRVHVRGGGRGPRGGGGPGCARARRRSRVRQRRKTRGAMLSRRRRGWRRARAERIRNHASRR